MSLSHLHSEERDTKVAHNLEKAWRITDVVTLNRADWRRLSLGMERVATQQCFLVLAESDNLPTHTERLSLYQAAHAVLPLHGDSLDALARLLIEAGALQLEWADVLIESLAQTPHGTPHAAAALSSLRQVLSRTVQGPSNSAERRRAYTLATQMASMGYRTAWLADLAAALAPRVPSQGHPGTTGRSQISGKRSHS